jgi:predicted molibdopterin-dependent oxidoreductase YjgC
VTGRTSEHARGSVRFFYGERTIGAREGDSVLTALVAAGETSVAKDGARGFFCNMGICQECRVIVDGRRGSRACLTRVAPGMRVTLEDA